MSTSAQSSHAAGHGTAAEVAQAQQEMSWPWIIGVGVGSILIFALATVWSTHILNSTRAEMQPGGPPLGWEESSPDRQSVLLRWVTGGMRPRLTISRSSRNNPNGTANASTPWAEIEQERLWR